MRKLLVVMFMLWAASGGAIAEERTDQLYWKCKERSEVPIVGLAQCSGYINGMIAMHGIMTTMRKSQPFFCLPKTGVSVEQGIRIFNQWVEQNPKQMHRGARVSLVVALAQAFPCK